MNSLGDGSNTCDFMIPYTLQVIRSIVEEKMDIQGGYAKPKVWDILLIQIIILPYTLYLWTRFYSRWLWKFGICREEYGEDEKLYVIRRNMKLSEGQFNVSISYS